MHSDLPAAVALLTKELRLSREERIKEFDWLKSVIGLATKQDLRETENRIMSAISDFAAKQKAFNDRQSKAIDQAVSGVSGLEQDVKSLNEKIEELQNSPGGVTPEDQALIDDLEKQGDDLATRTESLATALQTLDSQTPPVVPPTPV